ncbi:hypothetical protein CpB0148 [Chlamydia pneumoniae TW-183]|uniref:Uncharacterized protein n=2 Tax=Chlamydia pneumoniae TaxID=83558 RepID=Q9Z936_CHLPN|nr:hypothetical protein [Chlamydia pneumoniae]AAD18300.1 hypothetical protein CPn_0147 [Chlamydia pneumoniae CWL029]AAF38441.1 hypothetical protein CP_0626 [Chlamydia pneumoniae AR39]AAP98081.1 hypothetical protein CpB0148 [Chlamydia pneumoniae TW-183]CRI32643.1 Uncharacterized protein BN1224_Wien1_A_01500 [Chlamydia pneumoniae]CRI35505.1 Uncharacterized protein BN1224_CM1_A_01520 [Chlamydia pneumoniae]
MAVQSIKEAVTSAATSVGCVNCSREAIPAFNTEERATSIARSVIAAIIAVVAISLLGLGLVVLAGCCPLGMAAGAITMLLGVALLAWAILITLRLLNIPKAEIPSPGNNGEPNERNSATPPLEGGVAGEAGRGGGSPLTQLDLNSGAGS